MSILRGALTGAGYGVVLAITVSICILAWFRGIKALVWMLDHLTDRYGEDVAWAVTIVVGLSILSAATGAFAGAIGVVNTP